MSRYAAFLRGMNVGGHRVTNDELRGLFAAMGFAEVGTFRASGNVVFAAVAGPLAEIQARIEAELERSLGYAVPTFLRAADEVRAIVAMRPFDPEAVAASQGKLQVGLLAAPPARQARAKVLALASDEDRLAFGERELYWLPSGGMLESELDLKAIDLLLGATTRRTMNTIEQLAGKHFAA
jgi:uncharacterized protein (DUF1697 family)